VAISPPPQPRRRGPPDPALVELVRALARDAARRDHEAALASRAGRKREVADGDRRPTPGGV
jgi:hypothetical protein